MVGTGLIISSVLDIGKSIIDRLFPDPAAKAAAEMELMKMAHNGDLQQVIAQLEINAKEAQHASIWVAGWRPFFGWMGGAGFVYSVIVQPLLTWFATVKGWPSPPDLNIDLLWVVITGMLGIGGLRTIEKAKGVAK